MVTSILPVNNTLFKAAALFSALHFPLERSTEQADESGNYSFLLRKFFHIRSLGGVYQSWPTDISSTWHGNRKQKSGRAGDYREQGHAICSCQEDVVRGTVQCPPRARCESWLINMPASQPEAGTGSQHRREKGERGQEEVRRENKVLASHPVAGNFCCSKNSIQLTSLQRHVKAICITRQTENTWFRALKLWILERYDHIS